MKDITPQEEAIKILRELVRCGEFYYSAIEIDLHVKDRTDGEEFEAWIKDVLNHV